MTLHTAVKRPSVLIYFLGFLLGLHIALPTYVASTFLGQFMPEKFIGWIYVFSSALTITAFAILPRLMRRFGNIKIATTTLLLSISGAVIMALLKAPLLVVGAFILSYLSATVVAFVYDVFVEHVSSDMVTGEIRGSFLVSINTAFVLSQPLAGFLITDDYFGTVFLASAASAIILLVLTIFIFKKFKDSRYHEVPIIKILKTVRRHKAVMEIFTLDFLLRFFYSWMVIYMPIYLHNHIGFEWKEITLMFGIMLLPFILDQRPLGRIADRWLGEKELLIAGFIIMAFTTSAMSFLVGAGFLVWTSVLFASRIGASTVEIMTESYFFKHVSDRDVSLISFFRTTRPWAYLVGPAIATLLLPFIGIQYLFLVLGMLMLYGALRTLSLKDTK